ncbi:aminopeptidase [Tissierella sp. MSJ-40]|uniref:Aminopeptidase n=1 Tax=Tissierella simiarum TaxID=2841534 RepID=A0ABS6E3L2_9FIRM|nr:aminopeptidase [Tissierella simiarum]
MLFNTNNVWDKIDKEETEEVFKINEDYKEFLDKGKTERESIKEIIKRAEEKGFKSIEEILKENTRLLPGDKIYINNKDKGAALFVIGKNHIEKGMNIIGSHIDSPRLDLKQNPLYEDSDLAFLKTHYYGGVKKYQWVALPLALHGIILKKSGERIDVSIGEDHDEPVFYITDLLPHLAKDQMSKTLSDGITGEGLNILVGSIPFNDKDIKDKIKFNILKILYEKYGIIEEDFIAAELELVPAEKARDLGFDRSMVMAYGHDDRVCAYTSLKAILDIEEVDTTAVALFVDKEEIGSVGNTGMEAAFFENGLMEIVNLLEGEYNLSIVKKSLSNSKALSADVAAGYDPNYSDAYEKLNTAFIGKGITIVKYTGSRGKGGCNDANSEFVNYVRSIFNKNNIVWQSGELGKVDQGGGGTIAYILARHGMEVLDCGVPVLSMHAPYEVVSKADVYMTYKGYKAFYC